MKNRVHKFKLFHAFSVRLRVLVLLPLLMLVLGEMTAQEVDTEDIAKIVYLDSIVVQASKDDFSVADFIDMVQRDASFYLAFRNLRAAAYDFKTEMQFFDRNDDERASYQALQRQCIEDGCRFQKTVTETISGNLFRKRRKKENYYTYTLYDRLFRTHDTTCGISVVPQEINFEGRGVEGHVGELKKLIF